MGEKDLRSIWDDQEDEASQLDSPTADSPLFDSLSSPSGAATLENITAAKPERDRGWERRNPTASYRGVPQKLGQEAHAIAQMLEVTRSEVIQALLEYALKRYQQGQLALTPGPGRRRMTLFPNGDVPGWKQASKNPKPPKPKKGRRLKAGRKPWQNVMTFRIPQTLKADIKAVARQVGQVSPGEVVTAFLVEGLKDYQSGELALNPVTATVTLFPKAGAE